MYIIRQNSEAVHVGPSGHEIDLEGTPIPSGKYRATTTVTLTPIDPQPADPGLDIPE